MQQLNVIRVRLLVRHCRVRLLVRLMQQLNVIRVSVVRVTAGVRVKGTARGQGYARLGLEHGILCGS